MHVHALERDLKVKIPVTDNKLNTRRNFQNFEEI